jgi:hypothetical protein
MIRSQTKAPKKKKAQKTASNKQKRCATPALPDDPDTKPDAVDVVGIVPGDVYVDPELTEGHAGYEESGNSEITQHL